MPIKLTAVNKSKLLHGYTWQVPDERYLAELIARVALGQARHVQKILLAIGNVFPLPNDDIKTNAINMLTVPTGSDPWHRDGWMFQVMSWLAASKASPDSLIATPQMITAQKGFDGLQLDFDRSTGLVSAVVIFEDKATSNPRDTIYSQVWPDFKLLESGDRANVLVAEVTSLLERHPTVDVDEAIRKVIWAEARHFRVSITVQDTHSTSTGRDRLFKDYDTIVAGDIKRRRGETFHVADVRAWMSTIANMAISHITSLTPAHV